MLAKSSPVFDRIWAAVSALPVIDTHEHMAGPRFSEPPREPIAALIDGYLKGDILSCGADVENLATLRDPEVSTESKWPIFQKVWQRIQHTTYAHVSKIILQDVYGQEDFSLDALHRVAEQLPGHDENYYWKTLDEANIRLLVTDVLGLGPGDFNAWLSGEQDFPARFKMLIPLPLFHVLHSVDTGIRGWEAISDARDWFGVQTIGGWADCHVTCLDEFLESVFSTFKLAKARGAVGIKDQCAYMRTLSYELATRHEAERIFNRLLSDPRNVLGWPEARALDDYLFHQYMRFARELGLPVQVHTGHMANVYNRVDKANVALMAGVLELHQQVRFDLIHANWPYLGDILFLAKNYPNVVLNLTWVYIIDPLYAEETLRRSLVSVPHSKVHGFGGDYGDLPEYCVAHLKIAREIIASSLADMVERGWLSQSDALNVAADWLFNNPNSFWGLGQETIKGSNYL